MRVAMRRLVAFEKFRLEIEDAVEVEGVAADHARDRHRAALGVVDVGVRIDRAHMRLDVEKLRLAHEVGLVDEDHVGEGDLVFRLGRILQAVAQPLGVGDGDDRVELGSPADIGVDEEGLGDRRGIGEAGGLDDDRVELALAPHQTVDDANQVAAHGAADAAIVHFENFLVRIDDEVAIDADLAELVDDDGELLAVRLRQDAVEKGGLAGAEIAGQDGDGNLVAHDCAGLRSAPI